MFSLYVIEVKESCVLYCIDIYYDYYYFDIRPFNFFEFISRFAT